MSLDDYNDMRMKLALVTKQMDVLAIYKSQIINIDLSLLFDEYLKLMKEKIRLTDKIEQCEKYLDEESKFAVSHFLKGDMTIKEISKKLNTNKMNAYRKIDNFKNHIKNINME